ncbi:MAG: D-glycero-beta-D-manno-heptose 1,7-bisphosphate 7-phosphatase [Candidatus Viridilinea halotolerans]|uniref:D,D-heptose 1,7-bisphosphate phosphatase n=1 Tax=Candidatus Viridilinea halotolerans TaxID=2491704 RepID=A0A426TQ77_9CHLR|nr:MAG: D-glycero-beta-D-manno-heptose 1,7-bisphosphate 7-phosphatase [Candidatus Viridilinea halotolerans]
MQAFGLSLVPQQPSHDEGGRPAILLDRDGVINENRTDHVRSWNDFRFLPGSLTALRLLTAWGYRIFVVTNQAAVERGLLSLGTLQQIHARMCETAAAHGAQISAVRWCPHRPETRCGCRKPQPGMLLDLAATMQIDLVNTYIIGDALSDVIAGQAVGCRTILVRTGRGEEQLSLPAFQTNRPDHIANDLLAAVQLMHLARQNAG